MTWPSSSRVLHSKRDKNPLISMKFLLAPQRPGVYTEIRNIVYTVVGCICEHEWEGIHEIKQDHTADGRYTEAGI